MKGKKIILGIVTLSLLILLAINVSAVPALPCFFYGSLTIDDVDAPIGTEVVAKIDGEERGSIITGEVGKYGKVSGNPKLLVQGENSDNGKTIVFFINGLEADQTGIWKSGEIITLDLSVELDEDFDSQGNDKDDEQDKGDDSRDSGSGRDVDTTWPGEDTNFFDTKLEGGNTLIKVGMPSTEDLTEKQGLNVLPILTGILIIFTVLLAGFWIIKRV